MKKLTILCDNNTYIDQYLMGEPALSFLVETNEKKVLFDFGYSDVYLKNVEALGLELNCVDAAVLSHGHNDHTGGLQHWQCKPIPFYCHPECFGKTVFEGLDIGCPLTLEELNGKFEMHLTKEPAWITEDCCFLGEIPTRYEFEKRKPIGKKWRESWEDDLVKEDSALALKTSKGLWIITGCSHSGICSIIQYAKEVTGCHQIAGVIGGFHLLEQNDKLFKTIEVLKSFQIGCLIPTHCVNLAAKIEMAKVLQIEEAGSGLTIVFEE